MKFGYTLIYVEDVLATVGHYEQCFGLTRRFVAEGDQYAEMETGATTLGFVRYDLAAQSIAAYRPNRPEDIPPGSEIGFVTADVAAAYERAVQHGAQPLLAPVTKPWGQVVAYVRDLNGVLVELCSPLG